MLRSNSGVRLSPRSGPTSYVLNRPCCWHCWSKAASASAGGTARAVLPTTDRRDAVVQDGRPAVLGNAARFTQRAQDVRVRWPRRGSASFAGTVSGHARCHTPYRSDRPAKPNTVGAMPIEILSEAMRAHRRPSKTPKSWAAASADHTGQPRGRSGGRRAGICCSATSTAAGA